VTPYFTGLVVSALIYQKSHKAGKFLIICIVRISERSVFRQEKITMTNFAVLPNDGETGPYKTLQKTPPKQGCQIFLATTCQSWKNIPK
jgi:hypothetical protein